MKFKGKRVSLLKIKKKSHSQFKKRNKTKQSVNTTCGKRKLESDTCPKS